MAHSYAAAVILSIDSSKELSGSTLLVPQIDKPVPGLRGARYERPASEPHVRGYDFRHLCEVKTQLDHERCVAHLCSVALELELPPIVVAETWTPHGKWGFSAVLGMGEGWGWWTAELRRMQERHPALCGIYVERVEPNQWRDDLFGRKREQAREGLKRAAVGYIRVRARVDVPPDVAEAACVGFWGAQCDAVHEAVRRWQKRRKLFLNKPPTLPTSSKHPPSSSGRGAKRA